MVFILIVYAFIILISFITGLFVLKFSRKKDLVRVIPIENNESVENNIVSNININDNSQEIVEKTISIFNTDIIPVVIEDNSFESYDLKIEPVHKDDEIEIL